LTDSSVSECELISGESRKKGECIAAIHVENNGKKRDIYVLKTNPSLKVREVYLEKQSMSTKALQRVATIRCQDYKNGKSKLFQSC